ncbi:alginate export family protein [Croceitalea rosinachiae]|uniref:Alginate export family protein n=1 Tax=Croceitalea rosinachiae TaxID=3075596 RepID=A0ABU3A8B7_9FLAO|nr:alginate export family protein [Croceitalea sp. F388]MDT0606428.1 alginate export family protein [Croceitalea sp. F388]
MKKQYGLVILVILSVQLINAQFTLDGQFRPRAEYRNGFQTLIPDAADPGFAINTRARLNAGFTAETFKVYLSIQDLLVWGENPQIIPVDSNNSFAIFEAWAELQLGSGWSTKLGRQVLSYDDQRFFGGLDWAQQGRNHDLAMIKYKKDSFIMDIGLAFNQDLDDNGGPLFGFQNQGTTYPANNPFQYKTMQYLYAKQKWESFSASLLAVNYAHQNFDANGEADGVNSLLTLGSHLNYKKGSFGAAANVFIQSGTFFNGSTDVKGAFLLGLDLSYKASSKLGLGAGIEIISGDDADTNDKTEAFLPTFGTNHKFNGFMDYFYVGNHVNTIGLFDIHASANFKLGKKGSLFAKVLNFSGQQDLPSGENALGTEIDLVYTQGFKGFALKIGYSHLFPADGMYELKGITEELASDTQNWAWAMLIIKPKFLNTANN